MITGSFATLVLKLGTAKRAKSGITPQKLSPVNPLHAFHVSQKASVGTCTASEILSANRSSNP